MSPTLNTEYCEINFDYPKRGTTSLIILQRVRFAGEGKKKRWKTGYRLECGLSLSYPFRSRIYKT